VASNGQAVVIRRPGGVIAAGRRQHCLPRPERTDKKCAPATKVLSDRSASRRSSNGNAASIAEASDVVDGQDADGSIRTACER
jgi:hypothetical protein